MKIKEYYSIKRIFLFFVGLVLIFFCTGQVMGQTVEFIYFTDGGSGVGSTPPAEGFVKKINADGSGLETLVSGLLRPRGIALDHINGKLYWNDWDTSLTQKANIDGSLVATVYAHPPGPSGQGLNDIALDIGAEKIYTTLVAVSSPFRGVRRFNFDGTGVEDIYASVPPNGWFPDGIAVDTTNGHVYWGDGGQLNTNPANGIVRTDLDGSNFVPLVPFLAGRGRGMALDLANGKMYFAQHTRLGTGNGNVWQANLDGSGLTLIVSGLTRPRDVALDPFAGRIYWVDEATGKIQSANVDGSDVQDVKTGLISPDSLALSFKPAVAVDIKPGSCPNPLNVKSKGVLPVAIAGTSSFDVNQIDPSTVQLEGVSPLRWAYADVTTPFEPFLGKADCYADCNELCGDGIGDIIFNFDRQEILAALGFVDDEDCLVLVLTGNLKSEFGSWPIEGEDVIRILKKGKK